MEIGNSTMCNPLDRDPKLNPFLNSRKTWPFFFICILSTILNILLIYGLHRTSKPFNKTTTLFFLVSLTDIANALVSLAERIPEYMSDTVKQSDDFCTIVTFMPMLLWVTFYLQVILLCFLSSLRFISIYRPFTIITTKQLTISMLIAFALTFILNMTLVIMKYLDLNEEALILIWTYDSSLFIMVFYITIVNILSYIKLMPLRRKNTKKARTSLQIPLEKLQSVRSTPTYADGFENRAFSGDRRGENALENIPSNSVNDSKHRSTTTTTTTTTTAKKTGQINNTSRSMRAVLNQRKAVVTLLILTSLYWILCTPLIMLLALWTIQLYLKPNKLLVDFAYYLYYAYSGINSLVYIWRTKKLRTFFCSIVKRTTYGQTEQSPTET